MKKVSVIIPIYNAGDYLPRTLDAFLSQKYSDFEVIAVNDKSTDNSEMIICKYMPLFAQRGIDLILVNRESNGGLCAAINSGLMSAKGDYLCFPDADDEVSPNYLSSMMQILSEREVDWVRCNYVIALDEENREYDVILPLKSIYKNDFFDFISKFIPHNVWNMIVKRDYFEKCIGNQIYDSRLTQEWSILLPLSYHSNYARCEEKLYRYHIKNNAMSAWRNGDIASVIDHIEALQKLNITVMNRICAMKQTDMNLACEALEIYYHMLKSRKYGEKRCKESERDEIKKVFEICNKYIGSFEIREKILDADMYTRITFDAIMNADTDSLVEDYLSYSKIVSKGYRIVYDDGGKEIINMIISIYGEPKISCNYLDFSKNYSDDLPIMCFIQNSKNYKIFVNENRNVQFLEYRSVRNSIRGWASERMR